MNYRFAVGSGSSLRGIPGVSFIREKWRRIGVRLYLALGLAVALTLISGAVGVYHFEQSGDLNHRIQSETVPALEASWSAARETERLVNLGLSIVARPDSEFQGVDTEAISTTLTRLDTALDSIHPVPNLTQPAQSVSDTAYDLVGTIDDVIVNREELRTANADAAGHRARLASVGVDARGASSAIPVLQQALQAGEEASLDALWAQFTAVNDAGLDAGVASLGEDVFEARGRQLALEANLRHLALYFDALRVALEESVSSLIAASSLHSSDSLDMAVGSFDEGRTLLTAISVISVIAATLAAWLWVGNGMVRRLSRMSSRMQNMAAGDLETPVPEVGGDEIGRLANSLEVFRQQALEVQRLNLVEQLYEELRLTNDELQRTQARLVAQQKLAALGELVSGVAHEISNPLNFVHNFSEGSLELHKELSDMLQTYRDRMSAEDTALLDEIDQELTDSLNRVLSNGGRALAIVERMRGLGVVGGDPVMTDLNEALRTAVLLRCEVFNEEQDETEVHPVFDLDESLGEIPLVERDFSEAIYNLVSNACYAMQQKRQALDEHYEPMLAVSTRLADGVVDILVRDNGPGIPDNVVGQIFNPFFSTRDGALGAGLGLTIAADVARRLGGSLTVDTVFGQFAEFRLSLPATAEASAEPPNTVDAES